MVTKKTPAAKKTRAVKTSAAQSTGAAGRAYKREGVAGKAKAGVVYNPSGAPSEAAPSVPELMEPRPKTTSRYPISNEAFEALKAAAPKAKLPAATAVRSKDATRRKAAPPEAMAAMGPGLEPAEAPVGSSNFAGISATGWLPPDCTLAVGPSHVLASVNSSIAVYTKAGASLLQRTLTQWFANVVTGMTIFDPKALYDQHAGRWVLLAVAVSNSPKASLHLLSISTTSNPTGPWRNYRFNAMLDGSTATNNWADFPALGVDNQAVYVTSNMFAFGGGFQYAKIRVIPKTGPYAGGGAPYYDFWGMKNANNSVAFTIQPCHTFGAPQVEYLVNTAFPSGNTLTVWRLVNPTGIPVLTRTQVAVSPYSLAPNADQPGGVQALNTGDVRVLHAVFRGDSIWTAFTTAHNWTSATNRASIQWCQVRAAVPALVQQGVFGTSTLHYFYPACCPDANGNLTMVFSYSGSSTFGSIAYTGRRATDAPGTLQSSTILKSGVAKYVGLDSGGRNRWGDYNGVASDPANGRVVWMYSEYASAVNTWGTWVGSAFF